MAGFDELRDKAEKAAGDHPDMVEKASDQAIQRGGDAADQASGGKFGDKIDKGQATADERLGG